MQTQNKHIHIPNILALSGIRTSEDSTCLRALGYRDGCLVLSFLEIITEGWVQCKASVSKDITLQYRQAAIPQSGFDPLVLSVKREHKRNDECMTVWKEL
jgi:hypothetical protein